MHVDLRYLLVYTRQLAVFYCRIVARDHTLYYENSVGQVRMSIWLKNTVVADFTCNMTAGIGDS
jgi:hypothetical protein